MNTQVERLEHNMVKLTVTVPAEDFAKAITQAYNRNKKSISLPGFRKGHAPLQMIERMYGAGVFYEDAANILIPQTWPEASKESGLELTSRPEFDLVQIEKGKEFIYTATCAARPEVKLGEYKGIQVKKADLLVTDEEIENELKKEQDKNSRLVDIDDRAVEDGDTIHLDYSGSVDGELFDGGTAENQTLVIGSGSFIPGFEEQLIGTAIGEEKDVNVTFPADYHAAELAGKEAVFKCKVLKIQKKELPALDDDFAKDVSEFDTLDEYKASIRENLTKTRAERAEAAFKDAVMFQAAENITADIPEVMIEEKEEDILRNYAGQFGLRDRSVSLDEIKKMMGINDEIMEKSIRPAALSQVKTDLLLDAVMEAEELADTDEAFEAYVSKTAEEVGATAEQLKQYFGEDFMRHEFRKELATNLIVDSAVAKAE